MHTSSMTRRVVVPTAAHGNRLPVKSKAVAAPAPPAVQQASKQEVHTHGLVRYVKPTDEELYTYVSPVVQCSVTSVSPTAECCLTHKFT